MRPRWDQTLVSDMASGEPGLVSRKQGEREGRVTAFLFEVEDDEGNLVGIHWYSPGFDNYLDAATSNKLERGPVTPDPEPGIIASVDTGGAGIIEFVRNDPADPIQTLQARQTQKFLEQIGDETLQQARERAFNKALDHYGIKASRE